MLTCRRATDYVCARHGVTSAVGNDFRRDKKQKSEGETQSISFTNFLVVVNGTTNATKAIHTHIIQPMILKRQFNLWLCLALAPTNVAFLPQHIYRNDGVSSSSLDMTATLFPKTDSNEFKDIDIADVLHQAEQALMVAQDNLPSSTSIDKEWTEIQEMQKEIETRMGDKKPKNTPQFFQTIGNSFSQQVKGAIDFAHHTTDNKKDLSKVPEKMLKAVRTRANEGMEELVHKASVDIEEFKAKANSEMKTAPRKLETTLKKAATTEDVKKSSVRAFHAAKAFLGSKQVRQASSSAAKAIRDGLESPVMKALQSHAANELMDTIKKPTQQPALMDVSERDIDISDVLAEAEAALMIAETSTEPVSSAAATKTQKTTSSLFQAFRNKPMQRPQLHNVGERNIDIDDVLAKAKAALMAAESVESAPKEQNEEKRENALNNVFESVLAPKTAQQMIDVSSRDIDISDVLAEAEAALKIAESVETSVSLPSVVATTPVSLEIGEPDSSASWQKSGIGAQKWEQVKSFVKLQNEQTSPIRKSNRAILVHNLSEFMILQQEVTITSRDEIALFVKLQNERMSPVRKANRAVLTYNLKESAIMHKELLIAACRGISFYIKQQNEKMSPVRKANRGILAYTMVQSIVVQIESLRFAWDKIILFAKMQEKRMRPIRSNNRVNLVHTLSQFFQLERELVLEGRAKTSRKWAQAMVYLKLQHERMIPIRSTNRGILAHNLSEFWLLQRDLWSSSRQLLSKASTKLSQTAKELREQLKEDYEAPPPEAFLMGQF